MRLESGATSLHRFAGPWFQCVETCPVQDFQRSKAAAVATRKEWVSNVNCGEDDINPWGSRHGSG